MKSLSLYGRQVINVSVTDVFADDYPDFCDAYFDQAFYEDDGSELSDNELELLTSLYPDELCELAFNSLT